MPFETATHRAVAATRADIPQIQGFLEANPGYLEMIEGRPVQPDAAQREFEEEPPPELAYTRVDRLLVLDRTSGAMDGLIHVVEDLLAPGIWHISLFLVAEARHGSGFSAALYAALEQWANANGARWLRLGVAAVNERGARFWRRCGYVYVCSREVEARPGRVHTVWVLAKPLGGDDLAGYYAAQTRDAQAEPAAGWCDLVNAR